MCYFFLVENEWSFFLFLLLQHHLVQGVFLTKIRSQKTSYVVVQRPHTHMLQYQPPTQNSCTMSKPNSTLSIPCIIYGDFKFLLIIYPLSHTHRVVHELEASTTSDLIISYKSKLNLSSLVCICFQVIFFGLLYDLHYWNDW